MILQLTKRLDTILTNSYLGKNLYHDTYIRADIAAEREKKLIKAAYKAGAFEQRDCADEPLIEYEAALEEKYIYKDAGLEKLK